MIDSGLKDEHRSAIIDVIAANDRVERAVLFGSRAMGTNTVTSDVDIALYGDSLTLTDQTRLAETIDDIPMAQSVELVLYDSIDNPAFREHIQTRGVEWYRRAKADRLNLPSKHRTILKALLRTHLPDVEVWAHGSRVNGRSHDGSDLDLVLRGPDLKRIPSDCLAAFEEAVRESNIPFLGEARDWARLPERFHREIERDHVVLLGQEDRSSDARQLFGSLPEDWEFTTLGVACDRGGGGIQSGPFGSQLHASDYVPIGIPSIMPKNIGDNRINENGIARIGPDDAIRLSRYLVQEGDIVYSRRGDVERRALVRGAEEGWLCGTGCLRVRLGEGGVDPRYASYFLGHPSVREWIVRHAHGATMQNLNTSILSACPFVVQPKEEQRVTAHILGTLDDRIELNRRMNETLEAMVRALFKSWFVDFDPVRAKMEGRNPGLPKHLADLFPGCLVDSEVGETPEGWLHGMVHDLAFLNPESWSAKHPPRKVVYVDLANTKWGHIESVHTFSWTEAPSRARRVLRKGDTIIGTVRPENGSFALIDEDGLTGSTGFAVLRPHVATDRALVWCAATSPKNLGRLALLADGGAYPAVRPDEIGSTPVLVADPDIRAVFSRLADPLLDKIDRNKRGARDLAGLRDTLLPKLISGEIRLRDAERIVETVS